MAVSTVRPSQLLNQIKPLEELASFYVITNVFIVNIDSSSEQVQDALLLLNMPSAMRQTLKGLTVPVCDSVHNWCSGLLEGGTSRDLLKQILSKRNIGWTGCGTVDHESMARDIVTDDSLPVGFRLTVACEYCLENEIHRLWPLVADESKDTTGNEFSVANYWKLKLKGEINAAVTNSEVHTETEFLASRVLSSCNMSSIKYLWNHLTGEVQAEKMMEYARIVLTTAIRLPSSQYQPQVIRFFFNLLNPDQHIELIVDELESSSPPCSDLLNCLLYWPWQDSFLPMVERVHSSLTDDSNREDFQASLAEFYRHALLSLGEYNIMETYETIILQLWSKLSQVQQNIALLNFELYLLPLFMEQSIRCLNVIVKPVDDDERQSVAISDECMEFCLEMLNGGHVDVVKLVVRYLVPKNVRSVRVFENKFAEYSAKANAATCAVFSDDTDLDEFSLSSLAEILMKLGTMTNEYLKSDDQQ